MFKVNNKETRAISINVVLLFSLLFRTGIHTEDWVKQNLIVSLIKTLNIIWPGTETIGEMKAAIKRFLYSKNKQNKIKMRLFARFGTICTI